MVPPHDGYDGRNEGTSRGSCSIWVLERQEGRKGSQRLRLEVQPTTHDP